ncbi:MAG: DNA-3-methyladenine glycosylase I, partial [Candidatus Eremiobacteraeota bacterium]|nr:DNA-3-methyladenine glycosylase I [Candidatus Eremiobacteraeota bacterium]
IAYHDVEWGRPVHDERTLFEFLILEGAQAGLSWDTILRKRDRYRVVFAEFEPVRVARFSPAKVEQLMGDPGIVRNRLKIRSAIGNAKAFLCVQREFGSFDAYIWAFTAERVIRNRPRSACDVPARTALSDTISKDLRARGFSFVGSTIVYAYLQAVGIVNDHAAGCFVSRPLKRSKRRA